MGKGAGNLAQYSSNFSYLEAWTKSHVNSFLNLSDYVALNESETLHDFIVQMNGTDYCKYIEHHRDDENLTPAFLYDAMMAKLVDDFKYIRDSANEPLLEFLDYIRYSYMIDNVILIILGNLQGRDTSGLIKACHPLGLFDGMGALTTASTPAELYERVIADTPIAKYFEKVGYGEEAFSEINIEILRNTLHKVYLEDFMEYSQSLGGATADAMYPLLEFEADRRAIAIAINSIDSDMTLAERKDLLPRMGMLFPVGTDALAARENMEGVGLALATVDAYHAVFSASQDSEGALTVDDGMFKLETDLNRQSIVRFASFSVFYSFVKLRDQEIRNIRWLAERVHLGINEGITKLPVIRD